MLCLCAGSVRAGDFQTYSVLFKGGYEGVEKSKKTLPWKTKEEKKESKDIFLHWDLSQEW